MKLIVVIHRIVIIKYFILKVFDVRFLLKIKINFLKGYLIVVYQIACTAIIMANKNLGHPPTLLKLPQLDVMSTP